MMSKEAMKLALEALEHLQPTALTSFYTIGDRNKAITALREALAQPQQKPVAWMIWTHGPVLVFMNKDEANLEFDRLNRMYPEPTRMLVPLYKSPPAQHSASR